MEILLAGIFGSVTLGSAALFMLLGKRGAEDSGRRVKRRLGIGRIQKHEEITASVIRKDMLEQRKKITLPGVLNMRALLEKSGCGMSIGTFITLTVSMAAVAALTTWTVHRNVVSAALAAGVLASIPYLYVKMKVKKRKKLLTEQFPDALEMLTSSLRAGQAFATGLLAVSEEMPDPLATEFRMTFEEQNYGVSMSEALQHMAERFDTMDADFFVTAVNIQRETGGNLAEIFDNLGRTIRQRFKILGHIKALTAQGRLSGFIIGAMPVGIGLILMLINPSYMDPMLHSGLGRAMLGASLGMQVLGFLCIRKIVRIKV